MRVRLQKIFFALISCPFLLCSCGEQTPSQQTYDGREFDISVNQDKSLVCTSHKLSGGYYSLTITGSGKAVDYDRKDAVPWNPIAKKVNQITINDGIQNIGDYYFYTLPLTSYLLPASVKSVGDNSFNKSAVVYTYGDLLNNIDNSVYYYSETKPAISGNYFYVDDNGDPHVWIMETLSFLFIGNSFTYRGTDGADASNPEVPSDFKKIANSFNIDVNIDSVCKGSHTLTKFANPEDEMGRVVEQKLTTNQYDYVILQEQSTTPLNNYNTFLTAVTNLKKRIDETQENCQTILYETWGSPTGISGTNYKTVGEMEADLRTAYTNAGKETGCKVNYIGKAFTYAYENTNVNIYADDNRHQNGNGAYLSAACHVRSIFNIKVKDCVEYCGLNKDECKTLLGVADTVI